MTSDELAAEVAATVTRLQGRILGVGHEQYAKDGEQRFERLSPAQQVQEALEEADDLVVYGAMLGISLRRLQARLERVGGGFTVRDMRGSGSMTSACGPAVLMNRTTIVEPCPECIPGKCGNCDGRSWDTAQDCPAPCPCATFGHARRRS